MKYDPVVMRELDLVRNRLKADAANYHATCRELAWWLLPRRFKWLASRTSGSQPSASVRYPAAMIDSTPIDAIKICAAGMLGGVTSSSRQWFRLGLAVSEFEKTSSHPVTLWLSYCTKLLRKIFDESNYYTAMGILFEDLIVFGTAVIILEEDFENVVSFINVPMGEYFLGPDIFYREFSLSLEQIGKKFPDAVPSLPETFQTELKLQSKALGRHYDIGHIIRPNSGKVDAKFKYEEIYWLLQNDKVILRCSGSHDKRFIVMRWAAYGYEHWGSGIGIDVLGDVKQLQQAQRRTSEALDKLVRPPMLADVRLKGQPTSQLPGGVTYVPPGVDSGFRPSYQINPPIEAMLLKTQAIQKRIRELLFNDLFQSITSLNTVRSAEEIRGRREERLEALGPVLARISNEGFAPLIDLVFNMAQRADLIPPAPEEVQGADIEVAFSNIMSDTERAASTVPIERLLALVGNLAGIKPEVTDNIDFDRTVRVFSESTNTTPEIMHDPAFVETLRQARQAQEQQKALIQQTAVGVDAAKTLSETDVGGGQSALAAMLNGA